jgi:AraC family cel operon transcriptional repressor
MNKVHKLEDQYLLIKEGFNTQKLRNCVSETHKHSFYEITYIIMGTLKHEYNGIEVTLNVGDIVILRPNIDNHRIICENGQTSIKRDIMIKPSLFEKTCNFLSPDFFNFINNSPTPIMANLSIDELEIFEKIFSKIDYTNEQTISFPPDYLSLLSMIIVTVMKKMQLGEIKSKSWVEDIMKFLCTAVNFKFPLSKILEENFNYNLSYICKNFKNETGTTMTKYFNSSKLNYAKILLETTNETIYYICDECGFNNLSHFNREFKTRFKTTPSNYRKSLKRK